jgi:hypothetical protein
MTMEEIDLHSCLGSMTEWTIFGLNMNRSEVEGGVFTEELITNSMYILWQGWEQHVPLVWVGSLLWTLMGTGLRGNHCHVPPRQYKHTGFLLIVQYTTFMMDRFHGCILFRLWHDTKKSKGT